MNDGSCWTIDNVDNGENGLETLGSECTVDESVFNLNLRGAGNQSHLWGLRARE